MGCCTDKEEPPPPPGSEYGRDKPMPHKDIKSGGFGMCNIITANDKIISDVYELEPKNLGFGHYGTVCPAKHKITKAMWAAKTMSKANMKSVPRFRQEIAIMKMLDHPNIIRLHEIFEDEQNIYLVMEMANGQEVFDRILEAKHFSEKQAAVLAKQLLRAVHYMHESRIIHRDIKPENLLFMAPGPVTEVPLKVIDFGLSCSFQEGEILRTRLGTPCYAAPEVLNGSYNQVCDVWSCGVVLYVMLCGVLPFNGNSEAQVIKNVKLGMYRFPESKTAEAKAFVKGLLTKDPSKRFAAGRALREEWIEKCAPRSADTEEPELVNNLRKFVGMNRLVKAAMHVIASQLEGSEIKALTDLFKQLDTNDDGVLTREELILGVGKCTKDIPADLQGIINNIDCDGSGAIDYTEFLAAALDKRVALQRDVCWSAFCSLDRKGEGKVPTAALKDMLYHNEIQDIADTGSFIQLMEETDLNKDGDVDFEEFMMMMQSTVKNLYPGNQKNS